MRHTDVYDRLMASGLVSSKNDEPYFSHRHCDNCNALPGSRYEVEGYISLDDAKNEREKGDNLYTMELCENCYVALF